MEKETGIDPGMRTVGVEEIQYFTRVSSRSDSLAGKAWVVWLFLPIPRHPGVPGKYSLPCISLKEKMYQATVGN